MAALATKAAVGEDDRHASNSMCIEKNFLSFPSCSKRRHHHECRECFGFAVSHTKNVAPGLSLHRCGLKAAREQNRCAPDEETRKVERVTSRNRAL
jgi:hypothetical protein